MRHKVLEEAGYLPVLVHIDRQGRGLLGQARHRHDRTGDRHEEPRPRGET